VHAVEELVPRNRPQDDADPGAPRLQGHVEAVASAEVVRPREPRAGQVCANGVRASVANHQTGTDVVPAVSGIKDPSAHPDRTVAVLEVVIDPTDQMVPVLPTRARVRRRGDRDCAEAGDQHTEQCSYERPDGT
jgi:hypothetical protein